MFSDKQIRAYRTVTAPDSLYQKIKEKTDETNRFRATRNRFLALAACVVLVLGCVFLLHLEQNTKVMVNGQELRDSLSYADLQKGFEMRSSSHLTLDLEFQVERKTEIRVSHGVLVTKSGESAVSHTMEQDASFTWEISRSDLAAPCFLYLTDDKGSTRLALSYDDEENKILVCKEKQ